MSVALGAERVRKEFNPSGNPHVAYIKSQSVRLIDYMDQFKRDGEQARCAAEAQTRYEDAAMWAVKAATYTPGTISPVDWETQQK